MERYEMNEIGLFGGSLVFVFALSLQQQNVLARRYLPALVNSAFIATFNLFVIRLGSQATATEMIAFIAGQPLGTVLAIWVGGRSSRVQESGCSGCAQAAS
jgi:hypothetical protein